MKTLKIPFPTDCRRIIRLKFEQIPNEEYLICKALPEIVYDIEPIFNKDKYTSEWVNDITEMHRKFGVNPIIKSLDKEKLKAFLQFRINFLQEELDEMKNATNADDIVDALIDLCVVAIGTLDAFEVDSDESWNRVHEKNMQKEVGIKASRPNPLNLPDLIKPVGWTAPSHSDNVGLLSRLF